MDRSLIEKYAADASVPRRAIEGLSAADLNALPIPGTWSIQQIIVHLMDSDVIASDRMKRVVAMEKPLIAAYDETAFSQKLLYDRANVQMAADIFEKNRLMTADLLRALPDAVFQRTGLHTERGEITLEALVKMYAGHVDSHMTHLRKKRAMLNKPRGW